MERFKVGNAGAFPSVLCKQNVPFYIIEGRHKPLPKHSYCISLTLRTLPASLRVLFGLFRSAVDFLLTLAFGYCFVVRDLCLEELIDLSLNGSGRRSADTRSIVFLF